MNNDRLHLSPNQQWLFGVRNFRGPVLDVFDLAQGLVVRHLAPSGLEGNTGASGAWIGGSFYLYVALSGGRGHLWVVSPETTQLGDGLEVGPIGQAVGCSGPLVREITAGGSNLFLYELFGFKLDRRTKCPGRVPGGAWIVDPATGRLVHQITPDLHFSELISDRAGSTLYGLLAKDPWLETPVQLVRIDTRDERVLQSRVLDSSFWRMAVVALRVIPSGTVELDVQ
jgi:hypothetical protein